MFEKFRLKMRDYFWEFHEHKHKPHHPDIATIKAHIEREAICNDHLAISALKHEVLRLDTELGLLRDQVAELKKLQSFNQSAVILLDRKA